MLLHGQATADASPLTPPGGEKKQLQWTKKWLQSKSSVNNGTDRYGPTETERDV